MTSSRAQAEWNPWNYPVSATRPGMSGMSGRKDDLVGFDVEATDGHIGKIDEATYDVDASYVVVDTGPWIFGSKVMLPAGTIHLVDRDARKAFAARSKDEIKNAPRFDKDSYTKRDYRNRLGEYYRGFRY
jgi:hypothetical protein